MLQSLVYLCFWVINLLGLCAVWVFEVGLLVMLQTSLSTPIQGVQLRKEAVVVRGPLILVILVTELHIDLDQLRGTERC